MNTIQEVLEEIDEYTPDELRTLQAAINDRLERVVSESERERQFEEDLLRRGVISSIPDQTKATPSAQRPAPIVVEGPPVSETIVNERR